MTLGAAMSGSASIHPQMHQTKELHRLAATNSPGMELLSCVLMPRLTISLLSLLSLFILEALGRSWLRITLGKETSTEMAPMKLQKEEMRPVTKSARSTGSTDKEHLGKLCHHLTHGPRRS